MANTKRTLLVQERNGNLFKITIPAEWKVTFGAFSPGKAGVYSDEGPSLRIYEAESKQRACFVGVKSFRDLSLPLERLVIEESGETKWEVDGEGNRTRTEKVNRKKKSVKEDF